MFLRKASGVCHTQALERLRQENHKFKISLSFIIKLCLKNIPTSNSSMAKKGKNSQTYRHAQSKRSCDGYVQAGQEGGLVVTVTGRMLLEYLWE